MTNEEFACLFDREVATPLTGAGFHARGRSLHLADGDTQVALIRGHGRLAVPGSAVHILAFRHAFLREPKKLAVPREQPLHAEQYPWVLDPCELVGSAAREWSFVPARLMNLPFGSCRYDGRTNDAIVRELRGLREGILDRYLPWARAVTPEQGLEAMRAFRDEWFVARLWAEDYERCLAR